MLIATDLKVRIEPFCGDGVLLMPLCDNFERSCAMMPFFTLPRPPQRKSECTGVRPSLALNFGLHKEAEMPVVASNSVKVELPRCHAGHGEVSLSVLARCLNSGCELYGLVLASAESSQEVFFWLTCL